MKQCKAVIFGAAGTVLSDAERDFFREQNPWGFILFARNIAEPEQIRALVADMRSCTTRADTPVFIDQEGGRVQRLRPPLAPNYPPAADIGALYARDAHAGLRAAWLQARLHALDLARYDITADCLPVLDVPTEGAHDVIGNRAYGRSPESVAALGRAVVEGLLAGGVLPVMKHVPGHGRAGADTHLELPTVPAPLEELRDRDFRPFRSLRDIGMAMTAHVIYSAIDPSGPATTSPIVIRDIIRGEIGFDGLLMSDDVSMKALSGDFTTRAAAILEAGCDIVLHCNGVMDEMVAVAEGIGPLSGKSLERAGSALDPMGKTAAASPDALRREFAELLPLVA